MGILNAKKFLQHVDVDQKLQAQVNAAAWNTESMVTIAASNGYACTSNDLQSAMDDLWGILSEEELRNAAGGGGGNGNSQGDNSQGNSNSQGDTALSACSFYYGR